MNFLVEVDLERKQHILGVERRAIGKAQTMAQLHRELPAILRHRPGFRQRRFRLLRRAIDVDQVRRQPADDLPRRCVGRGHRIQRFGLTALRHHQRAAIVPDRVIGGEKVLSTLQSLGSGKRKARSAGKQEGGETSHTMHQGPPALSWLT